MAKQSDLENQPYLINLWCICISVASLFSAISRVLNFSSDQSEVAFLRDSSFRLFIRILLHFKGWQLDAEKMSLSLVCSEESATNESITPDQDQGDLPLTIEE
ncbi:hypothetical protein Gohar_014317 [Gossypium harknessii]|uniref:Uncharacterized protein n=1 Tax=Gossypium harknessii TaxID=34285 RepID=A0A7J9H325_9ROSI|nr:hypothetical protein [Gossypium harknessii]